jgi:polyhydroxybutyrate depolymerase
MVIAIFVILWLVWRPRNVLLWHSINVDGMERRYLVCSSNEGARRKPLLLCFHGGRAQVELLARRSGIAEAAQHHGCVVIFPEARDGWVDLRPERGGSSRDLDFVDALLDSVIANNQIDPARIFAFGISNGGQFVFRLACERPRRFAGFATALSNLPIAALSLQSGPPAPMALVFGRRDQIMPWQGGTLRRGPGFRAGGEVISARATVGFWIDRNHAQRQPQLRRFVSAGRSIRIEDYPAGMADGAPVRCVVIANWGHRWPRWGAASVGPDRFNAADLIAEFFFGLHGTSVNATTLMMGSVNA